RLLHELHPPLRRSRLLSSVLAALESAKATHSERAEAPGVIERPEGHQCVAPGDAAPSSSILCYLDRIDMDDRHCGCQRYGFPRIRPPSHGLQPRLFPCLTLVP